MKLNKYLILILLSNCIYLFSQEIDSLKIEYNYINTTPQNASVYLNNDYIGSTPVRFSNNIIDSVSKNEIKIKLKNYKDYIFNFDKKDVPIYKNFTLIPDNKLLKTDNMVLINQSKIFNKPRKTIPVVLSAIVSGGAAVFSFYYKRMANDRYNEYINTGDQSKLDLTKRYDLISGIGLAVFQVAFVSLLYFLLIQ